MEHPVPSRVPFPHQRVGHTGGADALSGLDWRRVAVDHVRVHEDQLDAADRRATREAFKFTNTRGPAMNGNIGHAKQRQKEPSRCGSRDSRREYM